MVLRDERSKARKQRYKFLGKKGRRKNGSSVNEIQALTSVEDNFLAEVYLLTSTNTPSTVKIRMSQPIATISDGASLQQEEKANEMNQVDCTEL